MKEGLQRIHGRGLPLPERIAATPMMIAISPQSNRGPGAPISDIAGLVAAGARLPERDDDAALVRRCKKGDTNAYRELVARHERRVMSILARVVAAQRSQRGDGHSLSDVEDLAQEVFVQAWRAMPRFRGDARFSTWLYRIATNRAIKEWRRGKRAPGEGWSESDLDDERGAGSGPVAEPHAGALDPEAIAQAGARDAQLRAAIDALPEKQRVVVLLHYYEEQSCDEIAQLLCCSIGTVWSRLHYACKKLRAHLGAADAIG